MAAQSSEPDAASTAVSINPETTLGAIRLNVADLDRVQAFYEDVLGLRTLERSDELARLGGREGGSVVELVGRPEAPRRPPGTTGLFHLAILLPSRADLARALRRVAAAGWRLGGASDHLVSEALYLRDPEDNGIEIYRDRPREEWRYVDGVPAMDTLPLDLEGVLGELNDHEAASRDAADTRLGHVHLQVADLRAAESLYHDVLGFDVTVRTYPGALFLSAGRYHHHIGVNTWAGEGAASPPAGALGLRWFEVLLPSPEELDSVAERLTAAGIHPREEELGLHVPDPSGNGILLRARA
jgi:catechol 2,3-dioxygenase